MIVEAVLVPQAPLLFRELTGREDVAHDVRVAAVDAVRAAVADVDAVTVVGEDGSAAPGVRRTWDPKTPPDVGIFGGRGGPNGGRSGLPLSLGIGRRLLDEAGWTGDLELEGLWPDPSAADLVAWAGRLDGGDARRLLLLTGDGSARRGITAPGYLDERAFGFDDDLAEALAAGDADALRRLDTGLADELMVLGSPAFRLLGSIGRPARSGLDYRGDPFGVSYFVARWSFTAAR